MNSPHIKYKGSCLILAASRQPVSRTGIRCIVGARRGWWVLVVVDAVLGVFTVAGYARFTVPLAGVLLVLAAPRGFRTALAALRRRGVGGAPPSAAPPPPARHSKTPSTREARVTDE